MNSDFCVGVHALVYLTHKGCPLTSDELADNICTNSARVRKVMAMLKKSGMIGTKEGINGGYKLIMDSTKISLADVARSLNITFVSSNWHSGSMDKECLVSSGMALKMDEIFSELDVLCYERIKGKTIKDIENSIFSKEKTK